MKKTEPEYYPPVENLLDLIYEHYTENNPVEKNTMMRKECGIFAKSSGERRVLIFQAFQLFSSSVQFCDRSRLPYPCRPESRKRNTCEPASAFCSPCRSILPCRQVRQVTNIYVLSFCVSSLSSFCILSRSSISVLLAGRTAFLLSCAIAPQSGHRSGSFSAEKQ